MLDGLSDPGNSFCLRMESSESLMALRSPSEGNPVKALTSGLLNTYSEINSKYYSKQKNKKQKIEQTNSFNYQLTPGFDFKSDPFALPVPTLNVEPTAKHKDYQVHNGEVLGGHYVIEGKIGRGSFGQVVAARDTFTNHEVAIKIIKNGKPFFVQAKTEIALLEEMKAKDAYDEYGVVHLLDHFVHNDHQCLVFEKLSLNLYDLLRKTSLSGISLNLIRNIGRQILVSLSFLKKLGIIHCDLKPENILLREQNHSVIKLIDFGSSCKLSQQLYTYIQSRFYRAPEILLGHRYGTEIDIWSLGCLLMELHTGEPLFSGSNEYEQMLKIVCLKGLPPSYLLEYSSKANVYFSREQGSDRWQFRLDQSNNSDIDSFPRSLEQVLGYDGGQNKVFQRRSNTEGHSFNDYRSFIDLIQRMLEYDPMKRLQPLEALRHPFFSTS